MLRQLAWVRGPRTQSPRHMGPPGPKIGGDPHACDTGIPEQPRSKRQITYISITIDIIRKGLETDHVLQYIALS